MSIKDNNNTLYQLIDSLSKSERRYFDLYASRHQIGNQNNYLLFYHIIKEHAISNDDKVQQHIQHLPFGKYLPIAKLQLFESILNSLHLYHQANSKEELLKRQLHQAKILMNKGFLSAALKRLRKTEKLMKEYELFQHGAEWHALQQEIIAKKGYEGYTDNDLLALQDTYHQYQVVQHNYHQYQLLFHRIYRIHFQEVKVKREADKDLIHELFHHELLSSPAQAKSIHAQIVYWQIKALDFFICGQPKEASNANQQLLELLENNPKIMILNSNKYLSILNNYLIDCLVLSKRNEFAKALEKLRSLPQNKAFKFQSNIDSKVFRISYLLELNANVSEGKFALNVGLEERIKKGLYKYGDKIAVHHKITIYYLMAYSFFGAADYEKCMDYAAEIKENLDGKVAADLHIAARLITLMAHFELGNYQLLEYTINNTRRFQQRRDKLTDTEALILSTLTKAIKSPKSEQRHVFIKAKQQIEAMEQAQGNTRLYANFDFKAWVLAKVNNQKFAESLTNLE